MFISVIIPVYNVEKYLGECLESILQQNFSEYEMICVNDSSTDRSAEILKEYANKYSQIKVIEHDINRGLSAARNTAMEHATGKYIMFVDSDDMIVPNCLEELYETAELHQLDIVYFGRSFLYDGVSEYKSGVQTTDMAVPDIGKVSTGREMFCYHMENEQYDAVVWRRFFRRKFLLENGLTFQEGIEHEDIEFSFVSALKAERVLNLNKEFYIYRQRSDSIVHTYGDEKAKSMFCVLINMFTYWNANTFTQEEHHAIAKYFRHYYEYYQSCRDFSTQNMEMGFGSHAEKALYRIFYEKRENKWLTLSRDQIEEIKKAKNVIVYGAGMAAREIITMLKENHIAIDSIAVDNVEENPEHFCGIPGEDYRMLEAYKDNAVIIIGVSRKYSHGIKETLGEFGFEHIVVASPIEK